MLLTAAVEWCDCLMDIFCNVRVDAHTNVTEVFMYSKTSIEINWQEQQ